jgi:hypothetical protein
MRVHEAPPHCLGEGKEFRGAADGDLNLAAAAEDVLRGYAVVLGEVGIGTASVRTLGHVAAHVPPLAILVVWVWLLTAGGIP